MPRFLQLQPRHGGERRRAPRDAARQGCGLEAEFTGLPETRLRLADLVAEFAAGTVKRKKAAEPAASAQA